jgi:hypothetical protein
VDAAVAEHAKDLKPTDHGGDILPFEHLHGRRFEILAYASS